MKLKFEVLTKPQHKFSTVSGQAGRQSRPKTGKPKTDQSRQTKNKNDIYANSTSRSSNRKKGQTANFLQTKMREMWECE